MEGLLSKMRAERIRTRRTTRMRWLSAAAVVLVAVMAAVVAIENGFQVAVMAPTEILAEQHYRTIVKLLHT